MVSVFDKLKEAVFKEIKDNLDPVYTYHSLAHTQDMLAILPNYTKDLELTAEQIDLLEIAVLFHDFGFLEDWKNHEIIGARKAVEVLGELGFKESSIRTVERLILVTKVPQKPKGLLEKIICDLDLDYLGRPDYEERSELLFKEWEALGVVNSREEWENIEIRFLENHEFHTEFGRSFRQPVLEEHIKRIKEERNG